MIGIIALLIGLLLPALSKAFTRKLRAVGGEAELRYVAGKTHASLHADLGTADDSAGRIIVDFILSTVSR